MHTDYRNGRRLITLLLAGGMLLGPAVTSLRAQDTPPEAPQKAKQEEENADQDPFIVPEGTADELLAFIIKVRRLRPENRAAAQEHAKKMYSAISAAASKILAIESLQPEQEQQALIHKFGALSTLSRIAPEAREELLELAKKYQDDPRSEIASLAGAQVLQAEAMTLASGTAEQAQELADHLLAYVKKVGVNRSSYGIASSIGRSLGYSENVEVGARLYESLSEVFESADDEQMRARAPSMLGAARRLRLPGSAIELTGLTGDGQEFDWSEYRGKVVLVDFWASWCGPCMAELPNMKKNLTLYGDKGFTIVGVNMDSTRAAYEKCLEEREITWVNLVSEEEGKTGWKAPMATFYGVSAIPTAILVDKEGKVVSLRARGAELDRLLVELLGPVANGEDKQDQDKKTEDK